MKNILIFTLMLAFVAMFNGCAAGAATAGYASKASTADGLTSKGMQTILETAKTQSDTYTDGQVIKLKGDLNNKILDLELRLKRLETK